MKGALELCVLSDDVVQVLLLPFLRLTVEDLKNPRVNGGH